MAIERAPRFGRRDPTLGPNQQALAELGSEASDIGITTFSALSGQGLGDVAEALRSWVPAAVAPAQAEPAATPAVPAVLP